jgi:hypothetical protein
MKMASDPTFRAVAILKAYSGRERELRAFMAEVLPEIRRVAGLRKLEASGSLSDPAHCMLYYCWDSPADSERYMAGALYAGIAPRLAALVEEHLLMVGELFSE